MKQRRCKRYRRNITKQESDQSTTTTETINHNNDRMNFSTENDIAPCYECDLFIENHTIYIAK